MRTPDKVINVELGKGRQSIEYVEVIDTTLGKFRIEIKSDSVKAQCYARISRWNGTEWSFVDSIHYSHMSTEEKLVYDPQVNARHFTDDRNKLLKTAKQIVNN